MGIASLVLMPKGVCYACLSQIFFMAHTWGGYLFLHQAH